MVYNALGQQVAVLQSGEQEAGYYEVQFDAGLRASGVYFYQLKAGDFLQTKKLVLLKRDRVPLNEQYNFFCSIKLFEGIMKKTEKFVGVVWLLCSLVVLPLIGKPSHSGSVSSQDSLSYFPLAIGNHWTYGSYWSLDFKTDCSIFDTARVDGRLYYLHTGASLTFIGKVGLPIDTLHSDNLGRLWRYEGGKKYMLFDFSHRDYPSHTTYPEVDVVRVLSNVDTTVPAGHITGCVDLYFRRSFYDESIGYLLPQAWGSCNRQW